MADFLSAADVVTIHDQVMKDTGSGFAPLRDEGLLESAVMRPQTAAYYESADLIYQAALLAIGISQNQPFADGNKRTAYAALDTFLIMNGRQYAGEPIELSKQLEKVAERKGTLDQATEDFVEWMRTHVSEVDEP